MQLSTITTVPESVAQEQFARVRVLEVLPREAGLFSPVKNLVSTEEGIGELDPFAFSLECSLPPPEVEAEEPKILHFSPSGVVNVGSNFNAYFSKPMVTLASHSTLAEQELPRSMIPLLDGEWYWMGAQTLLFQLKGHLSGSTRYHAEIAGEITAAEGDLFRGGKAWEFETERLGLV